MEKLKSSETSQKNLGLSKKTQNYSKAIAFSIATILGIQSSDSIGDNLLSDSTLQISKPLKETPESIKYKKDFSETFNNMMIEGSYEKIESDKGIIKAIEQKLKDNCAKSGKKCDIREKMELYKTIEKEIISYFKENISSGMNLFIIKLNKENVSKMLNLFPHLESIFKARFGENYMDILDKQTIENAEYNFEIIINDKNGELKIESMKLKKNIE